MKLQAASFNALDNLLTTLASVGIDKVIIEPGKIRAIDEMKTVGTITDQNVPDLDGKTVAVNRIKGLKDRISLAKAQGDVAITASLDAGGTVINQFEIAAGRSKSQFRCANVDSVKVPKTFNDTPTYDVPLAKSLIPLISQANSTAGAKTITIASKDGKAVTIELVDDTKDVFTFDVEKPATSLTGTTSGFCFKYMSSALQALLNGAAKTSTDDVTVTIGQQGILFVDVAGYRFFTLPQA